MAEYKTVITRSEVVTVAQSHTNNYGDLIFTDTTGKEHKITKKRDRLYPVIVEGRAVKLDYATYMNKEYIAEASLFDPTGGGTQPPAKTQPANPPQQPPKTVESPTEPPQVKSSPEIGMWLKELGDMIRSGRLEKDYPQAAVKIISQFYARMWQVTRIKPQ